jgi:hypothetical protein
MDAEVAVAQLDGKEQPSGCHMPVSAEYTMAATAGTVGNEGGMGRLEEAEHLPGLALAAGRSR